MLVKRTKSILKQFASPALDALGIFDRRLRTIPGSSWVIVMYHRVIEDLSDDPFGLGMCVTRKHFDQQLSFFRKSFNPIGMAEAIRRLEAGEPLPERALSVTFDDGYLDNYTVALPLLRAHSMDATLFVPTGGMDDAPLWWDRVIHALDATDAPALIPADVGLPIAEAKLSLGAWHRASSVLRVLDVLWTLPHDQVLECVRRIERMHPPKRPVAGLARRMSSEQVAQMHRNGVEIGAHAVKHSNLSLESPAVVRSELRDSRQALQALCDAPIDGFAYPAGWKNADTEAAVRECGFKYAVSTVNGVNTPASDRFTLSRVGMPDNAVPDLKRALVSVFQRHAGPSDQ